MILDAHEFIDLVVQLPYPFLAQALVLDIHDFTADFPQDLVPPRLGLVQIRALGCQVGPATWLFVGAIVLLCLAREIAVQHELRLFFVPRHDATYAMKKRAGGACKCVPAREAP